MLLTAKEVEFEPSSVVDPAGRLFHYEGRIYRGVSGETAVLAREILASPWAGDLVQAGMVESRIADFGLADFELVLEHRKVSFVSTSAEWALPMLRDAALTFCDVALVLARHGYSLNDAHPWNMMFDRCRPVFVDFGSIRRLNRSYVFPLREFRRHFLVPLALAGRLWGEAAHQTMREHPTGTGKVFADRAALRWMPPWYAVITLRYLESRRRDPQGAFIAFIERLRRRLAAMRVMPARGRWSDYPQNLGVLGEPSTYSTKAASVHQALEAGARGTLLDMACNRGWFSYLAEELGYQVVAFDYEPSAVAELYGRAREDGKNILPLRMDFLWPTPPFGMALGGQSAFERLQCDTSLVLALVHHLVFGQRVQFETIASVIHRYTRQRAIVEFIPAEDRYVRDWIAPEHEWYTQEGFIAAMKPYFSSAEILPSSPEPRSIIVFSR